MNTPNKRKHLSGPRKSSAAGNPSQVQIEVVDKPAEIKRFNQLLEDGHYLGETRPVGDFLRQVAIIDGQWVALLCWGSAAYRLKDRDAWIGWTPAQRVERLKLVVQNRRFMMLEKKAEHKGRASKILAASIRCLSAQWMERFGYAPLLAETFTDIEQFSGTCYKAAGWLPVGMSQGYSRHRADFYVANDRPKRLWLKSLHPEVRERLCAANLDAAHSEGEVDAPTGTLPLPDTQLRSLMEALQKVPDPRARNSRFRIGSVLGIVAMALLCGQRDIAQFHRFGWRLKQSQRTHLGLPLKKGTRRFRELPGYSVFYDLLSRVDIQALAKVLNEWLAQHAGRLPGALALDGKLIRETIGTLNLVEHETGVPVAQTIISRKTGDQGCSEMKAPLALLPGVNLECRTVTADALHTHPDTAGLIVERGGEYLLQIKGNQPSMHKQAKRIMANSPPLLPA